MKSPYIISAQKKLKRKKLITYLQEELENSSTHGLPYIVNTEIHWFERVFWAMSFLSCTLLIFVLLTSQYARFIKAPIVMSVEMDYFNWNVSFPAITLCPLIPIDKDPLNGLVDEFYRRTGRNLEIMIRTIAIANIDTVERLYLFTNNKDTEMISVIDPRDYAKIAASIINKLDNISLTTNTNQAVSMDAVMTEMGMCHVINSNVAKYHNPFKWNVRLKYVKQNIEISFYDGDFFTQVVNYAAIFKVYINYPDEIMLGASPSYSSDMEGFLYLGVRVWSTRISNILRLTPLRFRKCRFIHEVTSNRYPVYTYNHCLLECRIKMILQLCGCVPHFYKPLKSEKVCNLPELACIAKYKKEIKSLAATQQTLERFKYHKSLPRSSKDCECFSNCENDVYHKDRESFLPQTSMNRLRIGISSFPKVRVVRDIIFSLDDILLKSGGVVNLCIGTSIISLMELGLCAIKITILQFYYDISSAIKILADFILQRRLK